MIPRWVLVVPLVFSFCAMQVEFWDWDAPLRLQPIEDALGWTVVVFPHPLAITLLPLGAPAAMAIIIAIDAVLCIVLWRTQPPHLRIGRFSGILSIWIALSVGLTFTTPYLMSWTWQMGR